jgi:hypothetical protein
MRTAKTKLRARQPISKQLLVEWAKGAVEFKGLKQVERCLDNDLRKLAELGLIKFGGAAPAQPRHSQIGSES